MRWLEVLTFYHEIILTTWRPGNKDYSPKGKLSKTDCKQVKFSLAHEGVMLCLKLVKILSE